MRDATELMLAYRECARTVWNGTFRPEAEPYVDHDAVEAFGAVRDVLFREYVLRILGIETPARADRSEPYPFLKVRPRLDELPILIERPSSDGNHYWDEPVSRVASSGLSLVFVDFFDWDEFGYIDLQYYKVRMEKCSEHPHLVGRSALVEVRSARVEFDGGAGE